MPFSALGLSPPLLQALARNQLTIPTPVQSAAIPPAIAGRDVLARAQTGSGKTLAYGLPALQHLADSSPRPERPVRALVLVPTRELAVQVGESLRAIANQLPHAIKISVVFGGVSINRQMLALRGGTDLVVATPGRLLDLVASKAVSLAGLEVLVLDEADRLLDMGFSQELGSILTLLPPRRQSLFFSATYSAAVTALAHALLRDPAEVMPAEPEHTPDIAQWCIAVDAPRRTQLLRHLIEARHWRRLLVFVASRHAAEIVADKLRKARIDAEPFHSGLTQGKRMQVLSDFKASRLKVVVATDMASRGLDIAELPVVVNYDLPRSADDFTHRIGRTARAGESGVAVSFISATDLGHWELISKRHGLTAALDTVPGFEPLDAPPATTTAATAAPGNGGVKGRRPSKKDKARARAKPQP
jgi:superfamily II DNA/RNA helicase